MKDPLLLYALLSALVGSLLPTSGVATGVFDWVTKIATFLLFLGYGTRLSTAEVWAGLKYWWLHLTIFVRTLMVFPAVGSGLLHLPRYPPGLALGLTFLTLVPSTVRSSIMLMPIADGDIAEAVISATTSNLFGVILTPLLVIALLPTTGATPIGWDSFGAMMVQLLLPFILGQFSRPWIADFMTHDRKNLRWLDQGVICLVVYGALGDLHRNDITTTGVELLIMLALCLVILAFVLCFTRRLVRTPGLSHSDEITIVLCSTKKPLATGVSMATVLLVGQAVGLIAFPLMVFHTLRPIVYTIIA